MKGRAFTYSAYVDDRSTPRDVSEKVVPVVRVFVYYDRGMDPVKSWRCVLWYGRSAGVASERRRGVVTVVHAATDLNPEVKSTRYTECCLLSMQYSATIGARPSKKSRVTPYKQSSETLPLSSGTLSLTKF